MENFLHGIGINAYYMEKVSPFLDVSLANMPQELPFLCRTVILQACQICNAPDAMQNTLLQLADLIRANDDLKRFAWHVYYRLVIQTGIPLDFQSNSFVGWPVPDLPGQLGGHFYRLITYCIFPMAWEAYKQKKVPGEIIRATLLRNQSSGFFDPVSLAFQRNYLNASIYRLGRFEFMAHSPNGIEVVLRNRDSGRKLALLQAGAKLNRHGYYVIPGQESEEDVTTGFEETGTYVCGHAVNPYGFADCKTSTYHKSDWEIILCRQDKVLDMHIPNGGGMTPEVCIESFQLAFDFLDKIMPALCKPVIRSKSWIFNPDFEKELPNGNLAKLMRECYLYPAASTGEDGLYFLFGSKRYASWQEYPHDTSQRRAMLHILESGCALRSGGMLFFREDLPSFGTQYYRNSMSGMH